MSDALRSAWKATKDFMFNPISPALGLAVGGVGGSMSTALAVYEHIEGYHLGVVVHGAIAVLGGAIFAAHLPSYLKQRRLKRAHLHP